MRKTNGQTAHLYKEEIRLKTVWAPAPSGRFSISRQKHPRSGSSAPPDPRFLFVRTKRNQKAAQETTFLENLPSLRGFLFTPRPVWLFSPMSALGRCRSNHWNHSLALQPFSLGSPPRSTILWRDYRATGTVRAILPCHAGEAASCTLWAPPSLAVPLPAC